MASRADVETIIVKRLGGYMSSAGLAVTVAGSNADLADPIGWALRQLDYSVSDITDPTTAEVASVSAGDLDQFIDYAEYRTLENIIGNLTKVDTKVGPRSESYGQLLKQIEGLFAKLEKKLDDLYGISQASFETDFIVMDFAQHNETPVSDS